MAIGSNSRQWPSESSTGWFRRARIACDFDLPLDVMCITSRVGFFTIQFLSSIHLSFVKPQGIKEETGRQQPRQVATGHNVEGSSWCCSLTGHRTPQAQQWHEARALYVRQGKEITRSGREPLF